MEDSGNLPTTAEQQRDNVRLPDRREGSSRDKDREYLSGHEIIIKFHAQQKSRIASLLSEFFYDIHFAQSEDGNWVWAYCRYSGDIGELDQKLYDLKTKGLE